jgi:hypothetical protein
MPMSTWCLLKRRPGKVDVADALLFGDDKRDLLICRHCHRRVRPQAEAHDKSQGAHFHHLRRNPRCPLSHKSPTK